jgi:integrase
MYICRHNIVTLGVNMATIRKRDNGTWQAIVRRKGFPAQSRVYDLKVDAEDWARETERDIRRGEFKDRRNAANTTFGQVLEYYRENIVPQNKGKDSDLIRLDKLINSDLSKYSMAALTHEVIETWCKKYVQTKKVKGSTVNRVLNLMSAAINVGLKQFKLNVDNPINSVDRPANPDHRERRLVGDEEKYLMRALTLKALDEGKSSIGSRNPWLRPLTEFAIETAMRQGEMLDLDWQYVDMKRGVVHIPKSKLDRSEEARVSRDVPLSIRAIEILGSLPSNKGGLVFATTKDAVKKGFSRAIARARMAYERECKDKNESPLALMLVDLNFHDMRHEAASRLAKIYDVRQLAKIGGWKNLNTLAKYYNPTTEELVEKIRQHESKS